MLYGPPRTNQILSYYPKYSYLDEILTLSKKESINIYVDLKGCLQSLFQKWAVEYIITQSKGTQMVDTSVFRSTLEYIAFHKNYAKKRNIGLNMFFFLESGKSSYHLDIHKDYKKMRGIGDFFGLDDAHREFFFKIMDKNYYVIDHVCNKIPNVNVFRLMYLEADFVPWYLMEKALPTPLVENSANVIYSTDKDMLQCLNAENKFQFYRHYKHIKVITPKDVFPHFLKGELDLGPEWFCMALAIIGDDGDGFKGINGIGQKTCLKILPEIATICGSSMDKVYSNIYEKKTIFDRSYTPGNPATKKVIDHEDIIIRNLKLLSFKMLSDTLDGGFPTDMIRKKELILENVNLTKKAPNASVLFKALEKANLSDDLNENTIVELF